MIGGLDIGWLIVIFNTMTQIDNDWLHYKIVLFKETWLKKNEIIYFIKSKNNSKFS